MKSEWFESWFESPLYDLLYQHRSDDEAHAFIDNLLKEIEILSGSTVMDLGCGKGRHAIYMSKFGYAVIGLDLSERKIKFAKESSQEKNLSFAVHDMREEYGDGNEFDLVTNLFTSFGYFEDPREDLKILRAVEYALRQNGIFVMDFLNAPFVISGLVEEDLKQIGDWTIKINKSIENGFVVKKMVWNRGAELYHFEERVKLIAKSTFLDMFSHTNLEVQSIFGDYQLNEHNDGSPRIIFILKKN